MDQIRMRAYAHLIHDAFVDIRSLSGSYDLFPWNPFKWNASRRALKRSFGIADAFHNLSVFLTSDRFDEEAFWEQMESASKYFGLHQDYRKRFEEELSKLASEKCSATL